MIKKDYDILDKDIPNLIGKLIRFLGNNKVQCSLDKYDKALERSGPIFKEYYLKHRHPWWRTLLDYRRLEKSGKAIYKNVTSEIAALAADAKKILSEPHAAGVLKSLSEEIEKVDHLNADAYKEIMALVKHKTGENGKRLFMPVRAALTGRLKGLELEKVFALLGKKGILERIRR
ncbi:MAG: hypothetical protein HZB81_05155 [Deltaproteobacteria bacterium]|nr:hypothetical protein [Deltaproteobacteria bacterium]